MAVKVACINNKINCTHDKGLKPNNIIRESGFHFNEHIFNTCVDNVDLYGYFQSEKYLQPIEYYVK